MHIVHTKIGFNRGRRRLWQEGPRLAWAGFRPGARFTIVSDPERRRLVLRLSPSGERIVSSWARGATVRPIVDVAGAIVERVFGVSDDRVRCIFKAGEIEVSLAPIAVARASREDRLRRKLVEGAPLAVGSVFTGGGVLDHAIHAGLAAEGIGTVSSLVADFDADGLEVALFANPATRGARVSVEGPIDEVDTAQLPTLDLLIAGIPCTAASRQGRAKKQQFAMPEADTEAGHLVVSYLATVRATNPAIAVLENVVDYAGTASAHIIRTQLARWGYEVFQVQLAGGAHGALEDRRRWSVVAFSQGIAPVSFQVVATASRAGTLGQILEHVPADHVSWRRREYLELHAARHAAKGGGFKRNLVDGEARSITCIGRRYWKGRTTEPQLVAPHDPELARLLTPAEHARVKSLPADLADAVISGRSPTRAHELLGQSVVWNCFKDVGRAVGRALRSGAGLDQMAVQAEPVEQGQLVLAI